MGSMNALNGSTASSAGNAVTAASTALGYLGPEGTYTHQAAQAYVNNRPSATTAPLVTARRPYELIPYPDIAGILEAVSEEKVHGGIVPAENSIEGAVNLTLDILMQEAQLYIQGEFTLDIRHLLLSYTTELHRIQTVISHYQALAQCRNFLKKYLPNASIVTKESTADAVRLLAEQKQAGTAAIGSYAAHLRYRVPVLAADLGDYPQNQTSFLLIGKKPHPASFLSPVSQKTTFVVYPPENKPGELYNILSVFAKYQINLSKIFSRPHKSRPGNYLFWLDCALSPEHPNFPALLDELKHSSFHCKNLGTYPVYYFPPETVNSNVQNQH
jgi:prephenate dehydratase